MLILFFLLWPKGLFFVFNGWTNLPTVNQCGIREDKTDREVKDFLRSGSGLMSGAGATPMAGLALMPFGNSKGCESRQAATPLGLVAIPPSHPG